MNPYEQLEAAAAVYLDACALLKLPAREEPGDNAVRVVVYLSNIPIFTSLVAFGEVVAALGRKEKQKAIGGVPAYLHSCRMLLADFSHGRIRQAEPPEGQSPFLESLERLSKLYAYKGGGDVWHLMAALELAREYKPLAFLTFDDKLHAIAEGEGLLCPDLTAVDPNVLLTRLSNLGRAIGIGD